MPPRKRTAAKKTAPKPPLNIYQDLVSEVLAEEASKSADQPQTPPRKRRRVGERTTDDESVKSVASSGSKASVKLSKITRESGVAGPKDEPTGPKQAKTQQQVAYEDFQDEDTYDDETDADFEDVLPAASKEVLRVKPDPQDLQLDLNHDDRPSRTLSNARRRALTAADRKLRLDIHKMHVMALLQHLRVRSKWCNNETVQTSLRRLLPASVRKLFKDDENQTQWQRSRLLKTGLEKAGEVFREQFEISARGLSRCYWSESLGDTASEDALPKDADLPITEEDFVQASSSRTGSRDTGAQLFCALLRSLGLDVRLVCSIQPLPVQASFKPNTPAKPAPVIIPFHDTRTGMNPAPTMTRSAAVVNGLSNAATPGVRRFGQAPVAESPKRASIAPPKKKKIRESPYPVYWVEVFNMADQKWIPVDPLVLHLVDKPAKFEPPANDSENSMSYVLAADEDGYVKDVTRRYVNAYNAKTRRNRVEATRDGRQWWKRVMRWYADPLPQDHQQVEDAELTAKENREPMPRNIVEFKNHPYYALERHLRRNEVLHPKRQVGTVSAGANKPLESIYRRADVHLVRSPDAWFRQGRTIKLGEEPLKFLEPKKAQGRGEAQEDDGLDEPDLPGLHPGTPLFAAYQTQQYDPPPVLNGIVPKNMYGNIDIYTPSMVPAGGVWINHTLARNAARILMVDYADAVTGFEFKGRTGTAVVRGIVVAGEFYEGIIETIEGMRHVVEEEEIEKRTAKVLQTWKRFLLALRIKERVKNIHVDGEDAELAAQQSADNSDSGYDDDNDEEDAGGFLPDRDHQDSEIEASIPDLSMNQEPISTSTGLPSDIAAPIKSIWGKALPNLQTIPMEALERETAHLTGNSDMESGGFLPEDDMPGGFMPDTAEQLEGGFIADDAQDGGGFIPSTTSQQQQRGFVLSSPTQQQTSSLPSDYDPDYPDGYPDDSNASDATWDGHGPLPTNERSLARYIDQEHAAGKVPIPSSPEMEQAEIMVGIERALRADEEAARNAGLEGDEDEDWGGEALPYTAEEERGVDTTDFADPSTREAKKPALAREASDVSMKSAASAANSLISHDPEDEDAEADWL